MQKSCDDPAWVSTALAALVAGPVQHGTVLASSRFATYIMLAESTDPSVIALVAPGAVRLPVSVCVPHLPRLTVSAEAEVGDGKITADGHTWRAARWWDPKPRLDPRALRDQGWRLAAVIESEAASAYGVGAERARSVVAALVEGDPEPACALLGYGPGLTPAGDDVIAGAFAALALMDILPAAAAAVITSAARSRTTALSASLLLAAARGEVVPEAGRLLRSLAGTDNDHDRVSTMTQPLFTVGATSGHDLALGLAAALTSTARTTALEAT